MTEVQSNICAKALSHVGNHEEPMGSNAGPEVNEFLAYVGLGPGEPWCAAFACYVVGSVKTEMNGVWRVPHTGSSGAIVEWGKQNDAILETPIPGCLGMLEGDSPTGYIHTVIAVEVDGGTVKTVEGNEGDAVEHGERSVGACTWVRPFPSTLLEPATEAKFLRPEPENVSEWHEGTVSPAPVEKPVAVTPTETPSAPPVVTENEQEEPIMGDNEQTE